MKPVIECVGLNKAYGVKLALNNVSFECQAGEPIALVGANGAGKTTLFSVLSQFISPDSGTVKLLGLPLGDAALQGRVSALPQDAQLDPEFSVLRQLTLLAQLQQFNKADALQEAQRVLGLLGLADQGRSLPSALSHGMRKRVSIAQALIGSPELVFLDEPTAGLDPENARNIRSIIQSLSAQTTFIISSHNLDELEKLCKTVLLIDNGKLQRKSQIEEKVGDCDDAFLSLQLIQPANDAQIATLSSLQGVDELTVGASLDLLLRYNKNQYPTLDQRLLACLHEQGIEYR
ncbi:MAG: ABC transporter ATP-binding protein, partial [Sinobacterium sp.]|nr:ABC transporter ATP-binding protein [Sinobacterium sp.]